jgi:hypothetical protein
MECSSMVASEHSNASARRSTSNLDAGRRLGRERNSSSRSLDSSSFPALCARQLGDWSIEMIISGFHRSE